MSAGEESLHFRKLEEMTVALVGKGTCLLQRSETVDFTTFKSHPHLVDASLDCIQCSAKVQVSLTRKQLAVAISRPRGAAFSIGHPKPVSAVLIVHCTGTLIGRPELNIERVEAVTGRGIHITRGWKIGCVQNTARRSHVPGREKIGKKVTSKSLQEVGIPKCGLIPRLLGESGLPKSCGVAG